MSEKMAVTYEEFLEAQVIEEMKVIHEEMARWTTASVFFESYQRRMSKLNLKTLSWLDICDRLNKLRQRQFEIEQTGGDSELNRMRFKAIAAKEVVEALEIIAGERQCVDNLMGDADVARAALSTIREVP